MRRKNRLLFRPKHRSTIEKCKKLTKFSQILCIKYADKIWVVFRDKRLRMYFIFIGQLKRIGWRINSSDDSNTQPINIAKVKRDSPWRHKIQIHKKLFNLAKKRRSNSSHSPSLWRWSQNLNKREQWNLEIESYWINRGHFCVIAFNSKLQLTNRDHRGQGCKI